MTEVRDITCSEPTWASLVISSSVSPSEKFSCAGSEERLTRGKTAMERIAVGPGVTAVPFARNFTTRGTKYRVLAMTRIVAEAATPRRVLDHHFLTVSGRGTPAAWGTFASIRPGTWTIFRAPALEREPPFATVSM